MYASLLKRLTSNGFRRGMGGSRAWLVVGIVAAGARMLRRLARNEPEVLYRTAIKPGDMFEVVTRPRTK